MYLWKHPHSIRLLFALATLGFLSCNEGADFHSGVAEKFVTKSAVEKFRASNTEPQTYNFRFQQDSVKQEIELQMTGDRELEAEQINRPQRFEEFRQGHSGESQIEDFAVNELGKLDVLLVIDDSGSMEKYQTQLGQGLDSFLTHINNAAWQIAVITTTSACIRGDGLITRAQYDADPAATKLAFSAAVKAGINGSTFEKGILRTVEGLTGNCGDPNQNWLRADSHVAVLILTDEKNCGSATNEGCPGEPYETADYFFNSPHYVPGSQFFGLLGKDSFPGCLRWGTGDPVQYERLIAETAPDPAIAGAGNACASDYTDTLEQISAQITMQPRYRYELRYEPIPTTMQVKLDGRVLTEGTDYVTDGGNLIIKREIQLSDNRLQVKYDHSPQPIYDRFPLQLTADPATIAVTVDDEMMPEDSYEMDGDHLRFAEPPTERSMVRVSYRENTPLPNSFGVAENIVPETVQVWIENSPVQQFAINGDEVVFEKSPRDGQKIRISFHVESDRVTTYQMPAIDLAEIETLHMVDLETFAEVEATIKDGLLQIDPEVVFPGKKVLATYFIKPSTSPLVIRFDEPIANGTVEIDSANEECANAADISEHTIHFGCSAAEIEHIAINYEKIIDLKNTFEIVTPFGSDHTEWVVRIDGEESTAFTVDGTAVTIDASELTDQSEVEILVRWREPSR